MSTLESEVIIPSATTDGKQIPEANKPLPLWNRITAGALALAATLSVGILSAAGAIAIGGALPFAIPVIPFAIFAFIITAAVEAQVFFNNIKQAIQRLTDESINIALLLISIMAAIGFAAYTLTSAAALLPAFLFTAALAIASISAVSFGLIVYNTLCSETLSWANLKKCFKDHPFLGSMLLIATVALIGLTASGWWLESLEGFQLLTSLRLATVLNAITTPFTMLGFNLFLFINSFETVMTIKESDIDEKTSDYLTELKANPPGLKYNPFFYGAELVDIITSGILQVAHSACQALIAGRAGISNYFAFASIAIGTSLDLLCDANANSCSGDHFIFDCIVFGTKIVFTAPFQLFAVPTNYIISNSGGNQKSLSECLKENFKFVVKFYEHNILPHRKDNGSNDAASVTTAPAITAIAPNGASDFQIVAQGVLPASSVSPAVPANDAQHDQENATSLRRLSNSKS